MNDPDGTLRIANSDGTLTPQFQLWLIALIAELTAAQATIADHEARITALEP